ncbi:hypothetical protein HPB50_024262 [Hyalomma asiaticum]|uniref:Uncharacterized protein n=1 Tax=Hyalomma asiaticum TaxID=266040 RepID=A0ACB7SA18_HYAAI|nr:hypothetical protein HPB50_024262 [Hyalomma asiaticum]
MSSAARTGTRITSFHRGGSSATRRNVAQNLLSERILRTPNPATACASPCNALSPPIIPANKDAAGVTSRCRSRCDAWQGRHARSDAGARVHSQTRVHGEESAKRDPPRAV